MIIPSIKTEYWVYSKYKGLDETVHITHGYEELKIYLNEIETHIKNGGVQYCYFEEKKIAHLDIKMIKNGESQVA
jgi:hypothetical protein